MHLDLGGRTALITGGSTGLGKAITARLASSGANVVLLARNEERLAAAASDLAALGGGAVEPIACDVTDQAALEDAAAQALQRFPTIDILVNNAGSSFRRPFEGLARADFIADLALKLLA